MGYKGGIDRGGEPVMEDKLHSASLPFEAVNRTIQDYSF